jgi:spermidine/putrescine transport system ATP-binding protein
MAKELLRLERVNKSYDGRQILEDLDLTIHENEFVTLLGPSGCGKTTILRLIGGFEMPDSGKIWFDGQDITHLQPEKRQVNTVFQKYSLFSHMDVAENIAFGLELKGKSSSYIKDKIKYALKLVNLDGYEHARVTQMSGGQQQRVGIARALVVNPEIIFADEPTGNLDSNTTLDVLKLIKKIVAENKQTVVMVTHYECI